MSFKKRTGGLSLHATLSLATVLRRSLLAGRRHLPPAAVLIHFVLPQTLTQTISYLFSPNLILFFSSFLIWFWIFFSGHRL